MAEARELVQARLTEQVDELLLRDPLVRADAPDGVHKMRIATRRLRSNLSTFRPTLDREVTDPLRAELRWLGQVLGAARDSEVQAEHLQCALAELEPELVRGPVHALLHDHAEATQSEARAAAVEALDSPRYAALLDALTHLVNSPPWTPLASSSIDDVLLPRVRRDWRHLEQLVKSDADLHDVRKAAKQARYAAEPLVASHGHDAERFVAATTRIQSILGDRQDTVTARQQLMAIADEAALSGADTFTLGVLHERQRELAARLEADFRDLWRDMPRKKLHHWLA